MAVKIEFPGVADHETHFVNDLLSLPGVKEFFEAWQVMIKYEGLVDLGPKGCDRSDFVDDENDEGLTLLKKDPLIPQDLYDRAERSVETFCGNLTDLISSWRAQLLSLTEQVERLRMKSPTESPDETRE